MIKTPLTWSKAFAFYAFTIVMGFCFYCVIKNIAVEALIAIIPTTIASICLLFGVKVRGENRSRIMAQDREFEEMNHEA